MKKKTVLNKQPGKTETTKKRRTNDTKNIITIDHMPDWMEQYLESMGINREFDISELNSTQFSAFELSGKLYHSEKAGLIRVTFNPKTDTEPRAELTDYEREKLQRNEFW